MITMYHLMRLSIFILAGFSAVSAVVGLGDVFKEIFWFIVIAGLGLELGKYATVAYAYQEWEYLSLKFKILIISFVLPISLLTSVGVFGFLGHSFQSSHSTVAKSTLVSDQLQEDKKRLEDRLAAIDKQITELPATTVNGRIRLMKVFDEERTDIRAQLKDITPKMVAAQVNHVSVEEDLGPIVYLATAFGSTVDKAVSMMILALTLSFDPFAMFLTILSNRPRRNTTEPTEKSRPDVSVHAPVPEQTAPSVSVPVKKVPPKKPVAKKAAPKPIAKEPTVERPPKKEVKVFIEEDTAPSDASISENTTTNNVQAAISNFNLSSPP